MTTAQQRILALVAVAAASVFAVTVEQAEASPQTTKPPEEKSGYAPVNGLKMDYEITGEGKPAVYIHPMVSHCGLIPELTGNRQWVAMDLQGHGRTADVDRPMTCEQHADDIAALLKHLKIEEADFFGDSFGVLIACGDHDLIPVERCAELSRIIPNAQLAVIPNASHFILFSEPEKLMPTIAVFLDEAIPQAPLGTLETGYVPGVTR
jgi:pimeloyl-ACP methyl ester carboxylesterase